MAKRGRVDGHLSREEYENLNDSDDENRIIPTQTSLADYKATPNTMGARRIVTARRNNKKEQFAKHLLALNTSFQSWIKKQLEIDPSIDLTDGFQDYVDYSVALEDRYLRTYGELLTFGSGDCGQLAHGAENSEDLEVKFPRVVYSLRDKKVVGIACGGIHNAVYTANGHVYTWGCADDGSLGRTGDENLPALVESLTNETIIRVACGDGQTIAVTVKGEVYGWGCFKDKEGKKWFNPSPGNLSNAVKDIKKQQNTPIKIIGLENIIEISCGASFSLAKDSKGKIYSWGIGECGELGRFCPPLKKGTGEDIEYDIPSILKYHITPGSMYYTNGNEEMMSDIGLREVLDVKNFGCGAYHSLIAIVGDKVFACGLNNYGQLGLGDTTNRIHLTEVSRLEGKGVIQLRGGMHHSLVCTSHGELFAFGRGDSGQLGSSDCGKQAGDFKNIPIQPSVPTNTFFTSIDCGGNHNLALTDKGDVYTWGYGDMLALGHGEEKDELLPKKLNFAKAKIRNISVTQVAGGGQHSAIIGKVVST